MKVWSDGHDVVLARSVADVPKVLDEHYQVVGHRVHRERWHPIDREGLTRMGVSVELTRLETTVPEWLGRFKQR